MKAKKPFRFYNRLSLSLATGKRARSLGELAGFIATLPPDVIYYHTHRFLHDHQFLVPEPKNDFAYWAEDILENPPLADALAKVDPLRFTNLEDMRRAFLDALAPYARSGDAGKNVMEGKEFYFLSARRFSVPTTHEADDLDSFKDQLGKVGLASLYLHLFEARLRLPSGGNDFSVWLERDMGMPDLAKRVGALDLYSKTLPDLRQEIIAILGGQLARA